MFRLGGQVRASASRRRESELEGFGRAGRASWRRRAFRFPGASTRDGSMALADVSTIQPVRVLENCPDTLASSRTRRLPELLPLTGRSGALNSLTACPFSAGPACHEINSSLSRAVLPRFHALRGRETPGPSKWRGLLDLESNTNPHKNLSSRTVSCARSR